MTSRHNFRSCSSGDVSLTNPCPQQSQVFPYLICPATPALSSVCLHISLHWAGNSRKVRSIWDSKVFPKLWRAHKCSINPPDNAAASFTPQTCLIKLTQSSETARGMSDRGRWLNHRGIFMAGESTTGCSCYSAVNSPCDLEKNPFPKTLLSINKTISMVPRLLISVLST